MSRTSGHERWSGRERRKHQKPHLVDVCVHWTQQGGTAKAAELNSCKMQEAEVVVPLLPPKDGASPSCTENKVPKEQRLYHWPIWHHVGTLEKDSCTLIFYNIVLDTAEIQNTETVHVPDPLCVTCHKRWIFLLSHSNLIMFMSTYRLPKISWSHFRPCSPTEEKEILKNVIYWIFLWEFSGRNSQRSNFMLLLWINRILFTSQEGILPSFSCFWQARNLFPIFLFVWKSW